MEAETLLPSALLCAASSTRGLLAVLSWPNNLSQNWKATVQRAERAVGLGAAPDESYNCDVDFTDWKLAWSNTKSLGVGQVKGRGD